MNTAFRIRNSAVMRLSDSCSEMDSGCKQSRYPRHGLKVTLCRRLELSKTLLSASTCMGAFAMERRDIVHSEQAFNGNFEPVQSGVAAAESFSIAGQVKWFDFT